ncbi:MAG: DNA-binding response OmpR family regulator/anti-sigma regulatory factor (Ser/Thr protein kinase) [Paraglaciecola sp.]|jgi:DNA-binding response OmpR family regulator/anti-sigma regulatory factor (Ser/Thr protein kinase)|uniref:ATP-binding SpoIIE family protein phosphatase n=2 Tax=Alteromonadales TaxID=135622 RepID=UPI0025F2ADE3|nr:fused response regulator/phosphatase [uncultured Paraglaciecola sp.]
MRILVVDDDAINRFLLINMLEQQGYLDTFEAEDGLVAVELAQRLKPDLVLLDVVMPKMDGHQVATILKKLTGDIYLPIIFITAVDDEESLARCLEAGGDDFVSKPVNKVILTAKIRVHARTRLLSKKAAEQNKQLYFYQNSTEREHKIVEHIFANALSVDKSFTQYLDYCLNPASNFNGDLFLASASPTGGMYFLIGDFTGHGLASAIGALPVSQAFQTMSRKGLSLMEMAETINQTLLMLLPDDMFFAAAIVEINNTGKQIDVWNGGMPNLLLQDASGKIMKRLVSRHMSLGILEANEFESDTERYEMKFGDRLVAFSDGIVELENQNKDMLGDDGIENWLSGQPDISVQEIIGKATEYLGSIKRKDDITIVIFTSQPFEPMVHKYMASKIPIKIIIELDAEHIKLADPVVDLVNVMTNQLGLHSIHSDLFTVLSELYNNALEHGVLELDSALKQSEDGFFAYYALREEKLSVLTSARIIISAHYHPDEKTLAIRIIDSGTGFKHKHMLNLDNVEKSYGRGISLVKELSDSVTYGNNGNTVDVVFKI